MKNASNEQEFWGEEVSDFETLIRCFQLRYNEYSNINLGAFVEPNLHNLDIDNYDLYSRHWILTNKNRDILGYGRIVTGKPTFFAEEIKSLAQRKGLKDFDPNFEFSNYTCAYDNIPKTLKKNILKLEREIKVVETSRLIIIDKSNALRYAIFLVESAIGQALIEADMIISSCLKNQVKLYERYGYGYLEGGESYDIKGTEFASMYLTKKMILEKHRARIHEKGLLAQNRSIKFRGITKLSPQPKHYRNVV